MFNNLLLLTQTEGREREARGREAKRMREEHQRKTQGDEMEWYMGGKGLKRGSSNLRPENRRRGRRGLEMEIKSRKRRCMMEQVEGQQRRKVGASEEHGRIFWTPLNILWLPKEKKNNNMEVLQIRSHCVIRNTKEMPSLWKCSHFAHQRLPNHLLPTVRHSTERHSSSKPINRQPNHKQEALPNQQHFSVPVEAANHNRCLSARPSDRRNAAQYRNARSGWWVGRWWWWWGLIWGQSIDLPSLYLLPTQHTKINGEANSSPPQSGLVNTQLISQSLKLTSQLLTYRYERHVLSKTSHTHTHADGRSNTNTCAASWKDKRKHKKNLPLVSRTLSNQCKGETMSNCQS